MSCSVCTCTHHLAIHDVSGDEPGACLYRGGCDCKAFALLDVIAWAKQPRIAP